MRQTIDRDGMEKTLQMDKKPEERNERWYDLLRETTAYDKLIQFKDVHTKQIRVSTRGKRWWDKELTTQPKATRKASSGGRKHKKR